MTFTKLLSFTKKVADLPDAPALTPAALKAQFDAAPDELRLTFNNLVDALTQTTSGDSGAKNVGATTISGLTGSDVQTILNSLKTYIDTTRLKSPSGLRMELHGGLFFVNGGSNKSTANVTFDTPFTSTPQVFLGDLNNIQPYGNTLCFPNIYNRTINGFACDIQTVGGQNLGTVGNPQNMNISFLVIGV
jgi:hypothetical protein